MAQDNRRVKDKAGPFKPFHRKSQIRGGGDEEEQALISDSDHVAAESSEIRHRAGNSRREICCASTQFLFFAL